MDVCSEINESRENECLLALLLKLLSWAIFLFPPSREFREGISKDTFPFHFSRDISLINGTSTVIEQVQIYSRTYIECKVLSGVLYMNCLITF